MMNADMDAVDAENQVELEEKTRLINQVLELQHTLEVGTGWPNKKSQFGKWNKGKHAKIVECSWEMCEDFVPSSGAVP
ncbi:hypothetical protein H8959_009274 [Pygathrix nigripes]